MFFRRDLLVGRIGRHVGHCIPTAADPRPGGEGFIGRRRGDVGLTGLARDDPTEMGHRFGVVDRQRQRHGTGLVVGYPVGLENDVLHGLRRDFQPALRHEKRVFPLVVIRGPRQIPIHGGITAGAFREANRRPRTVDDHRRPCPPDRGRNREVHRRHLGRVVISAQAGLGDHAVILVDHGLDRNIRCIDGAVVQDRRSHRVAGPDGQRQIAVGGLDMQDGRCLGQNLGILGRPDISAIHGDFGASLLETGKVGEIDLWQQIDQPIDHALGQGIQVRCAGDITVRVDEAVDIGIRSRADIDQVVLQSGRLESDIRPADQRAGG